MLNELTTQYSLVNAYVFGWLPDESVKSGLAQSIGGKTAIGDDDPLEGTTIFAHELAHLLGRRHANTEGSMADSNCRYTSLNIDRDSDWPFPISTIDNYGLDVLSTDNSLKVKPPDSYYDYMSYCGRLSRGNVWTSSWTYGHIYSETLRPQAGSSARRPVAAPQPQLIVSGLVYNDDRAVLDPVWAITSAASSNGFPRGTAYCLEVQNASSIPLSTRCFDLTFVDYETGEVTDLKGFSLMLPASSGAARVVLKKGTTELVARHLSSNSPVVTVLSPNGGESWAASGTQTITWAATDADGDSLTFRVLYSPDGISWMPMGTATSATQLIVNAAELAGGSGAKVRVLASDGANTSADESDAPFGVGRKGPQSFIQSPERDSELPGSLVYLQGYAYDMEDGTLPDSALRWTSSNGGYIGTGSQALASLSAGQQVVTLTVTDSDGNIATSSVNVNVRPPSNAVYLPLVTRGFGSGW